MSVAQATPESVLHPDRLSSADPGLGPIARRIHDAGRELPIISPYGHVGPRLLHVDAVGADAERFERETQE